MKGSGLRKTLTLAASAALACLLLPPPAAAKLGKGDARKLIAALSVFELNSGAITIKEISSTDSEATVLASVRAAFRFARGEGGRWRAVEARVGDRQWEDFDLLAAAAGAERINAARAALDSLAAELEERARGRRRAAGEGDKDAPGDDAPLERGPVRVDKPAAALSALGSSAVLEAEVEASFDFVRERGRWRVARARLGAETVSDFDSPARALDQAKSARARADLGALASALEAHRRERGFYVPVDTASALNDHLSPRYLPAPVRFDPWHRSYEYQGARAGYLLRSLGPDGKPNTADDVTIRK
ncbi:MAG TPA: type II secretion system protein GspG [Pyrinomonadaceae bacterium]|nr:type II secretion system protein GspG [Pyrinomonadaceae bacterium]